MQNNYGWNNRPNPGMYNGYNNNNGFGNNSYNNVMNAPHYEIIRVSGREGVNNLPMGPNSEVILRDLISPMTIWYVTTDGAGTKNAIPYDLVFHQDVPPVDVNDLARRVSALEEQYVSQSNTRMATTNNNAKSNNKSAANATA